MNEEDFPDEYVPSKLRTECIRERDQEMFGCGIRTGGRTVIGMTHGPFSSLQEALEVIPEKTSEGKPVIVHFKANGVDDVVYTWKRGKWIRYIKPKRKQG